MQIHFLRYAAKKGGVIYILVDMPKYVLIFIYFKRCTIVLSKPYTGY